MLISWAVLPLLLALAHAAAHTVPLDIELDRRVIRLHLDTSLEASSTRHHGDEADREERRLDPVVSAVCHDFSFSAEECGALARAAEARVGEDHRRAARRGDGDESQYGTSGDEDISATLKLRLTDHYARAREAERTRGAADTDALVTVIWLTTDTSGPIAQRREWLEYLLGRKGDGGVSGGGAGGREVHRTHAAEAAAAAVRVRHVNDPHLQTVVDRALIVASAFNCESGDLRLLPYLSKFDGRGYRYSLLHLGDERNNGCFAPYPMAQFVLRTDPHRSFVGWPHVSLLMTGHLSGRAFSVADAKSGSGVAEATAKLREQAMQGG